MNESIDYKHKHKRVTPEVKSIGTRARNNYILASSIGITWGCYLSAWLPLAMSNDAGAYFTDCTTMWTMYVYFYEDAKQIDYQQY